MNGKLLQRLRKWHKWPSLIFTLFILLFALSGIILNHRDLLSGLDVNRKLLPPGYRYHNWNLGAIRGTVPWQEDSVLVYGNIGIWAAGKDLDSLISLNHGFPDGIDNRKVSSVVVDSRVGIYAGTLFGLYGYDKATRKWKKLALPVDEERVVKVLTKGDSLLVMTRSHLLVSTSGKSMPAFSEIQVPAAVDDDGTISLFKTLWEIHSGAIYGLVGKLLVDAIALVFIILCITGVIYFFVPYRLKRLTDGIRRSRLKKFNRNNLRWHNILGSWSVLFLILTTLTGMFLRPPLLIPIANARVGKIPYTELADPNPWFDRFRDVLWDNDNQRWLLATSEGMYHTDPAFSGALVPFDNQPPVSIMGINVFQQMDSTNFLVGSFSGIFQWNPGSGKIIDHFTKMPYQGPTRGNPFGALSVSGYGRIHDREILFDYMGGAISLNKGFRFPRMPEEVIRQSPISLWNTALEIHTGRIFEPFLGSWYILVVPLVGLFALEIIIVGFFAWYLAKRKKQRKGPS